jgi:hypothetical protein
LTAFTNDIFEGEVVKIKPVTDPETRTFLTYIRLNNPDLKFIPGLTSFVRIKKTHRRLAVPSIALISPTGVRESTVFVIENGVLARLRKVHVGVAAEGMTEILQGLTEGMEVAVVGQLNLRDSDSVRVGDEFSTLSVKALDERHGQSYMGIIAYWSSAFARVASRLPFPDRGKYADHPNGATWTRHGVAPPGCINVCPSRPRQPRGSSK